MMIARSWHGAVRAADAEEYHRYLLETGLADYRSAEGNRGVHALLRREGEVAHFLLITEWSGWDAIRTFAGDDPERARYYPEDRRFLLGLEPGVLHHQVIAAPDRARSEGARIARIWRGWTDEARADAYQRLLLDEVIPGIIGQGIAGFRGMHLLRRAADHEQEFVTIMWFDSMDAVARFGDPEDPERAVVHPPARALLSRFDERSRHYEQL
jgi:heme-degrading monooxygenase HmoA